MTNSSRRVLLPYFVFVLVVALRSEGQAPSSLDVRKFVSKHCTDCHQGESPEGGLDLEALKFDLNDPDVFQRWVRVFDRVKNGEMPPKDAAILPASERKTFVAGTHTWLSDHQSRQWQRLGRVRGRRLTNVQLERTLHDLLGIDIPLASQMPEEPKSSLFTTVANGQAMSHFQLQEHLKVVDSALNEAFELATRETDNLVRKLDGRRLSRRSSRRRTREPELIDGLAATWSSRLIFYGRLPSTTARESGWYRFTIRAKALKSPKDHGVWCTVRSGKCVSSAPLLNWVGAFEATDQMQEWTFETWLPKGDMLEVRPGDSTLKRARFRGGQVGVGEGGPQNVPGVALESLKMERIHYGPDRDRIQSTLFGDLNVEGGAAGWRETTLKSVAPKKDVGLLMTRFARRAFRRPVSRTDIEEYIHYAQQSIDEGMSLIEALQLGYRSLLCSPRFLYLTEEPGELDQYAVASRLSYFLWNTMPDDELLKLADRRQLHQTSIIRAQVQRLLNDDKGQKFVGDLANQWLDLSEIDFTTPDRRLYPGFDVIVQQSMVSESVRFLQDLLDRNLSVTALIDSDHTFLNERLARFYEIDGVDGDDLQKTMLTKDDHRGGLLTQGAILKVTANGTNTSPVMRGVWVSERLLGEHIPPPPSGVAAIEPDIRGAKTIREMLQKHKSDPSCATCHKTIDPPGFALENFDPAGRWREKYLQIKGRRVTRGVNVDPSSKLAGGGEFKNLREFQRLITNSPEKLAANVAEKLLTYGTGAPITFADRGEIDRIVAQSKSSNYGFRSIVEEVAASRIFRIK